MNQAYSESSAESLLSLGPLRLYPCGPESLLGRCSATDFITSRLHVIRRCVCEL